VSLREPALSGDPCHPERRALSADREGALHRVASGVTPHPNVITVSLQVTHKGEDETPTEPLVSDHELSVSGLR
jgi:hypothetical protein